MGYKTKRKYSKGALGLEPPGLEYGTHKATLNAVTQHTLGFHLQVHLSPTYHIFSFKNQKKKVQGAHHCGVAPGNHRPLASTSQAGVAGFHVYPSALGQEATVTYKGVLRPHASADEGIPQEGSPFAKQAKTDTVLHKWVVGPQSHQHALQASEL